MPIRHGNTYRALGWLITAILLVVSGFALSQDVEPRPPEEKGVARSEPTQSGKAKEQPKTKQPDPKKSVEPPTRPSGDIEGQDAAPSTDPNTNDPHDYNREDLDAQRRMADAAEELVYITKIEIALLALGSTGLLFTIIFTIRTYRLSANTAQRQLRAYVCVTVVGLRFHRHRVRATTIVTNHGTTPAYALRTQGGLMLCPFPSDTPFEGWNDSAEDESVAIVGPGKPSEDFTEIAITNDQYDELRTGKMALYAFGEYRYKDAFKHDRFTKYRFMVGGDTGFNAEAMSPCKEGNEAD